MCMCTIYYKYMTLIYVYMYVQVYDACTLYKTLFLLSLFCFAQGRAVPTSTATVTLSSSVA